MSRAVAEREPRAAPPRAPYANLNASGDVLRAPPEGRASAPRSGAVSSPDSPQGA